MDDLIKILDSTGLQTLVGLIVGAFVFIQYRINKTDQLKNAAQLILIDVQSAERKVKNIKSRLTDSNALETDVTVINQESWTSYRHMLSRFFDRDEWDDLNTFYDKTLLLDKTIAYNSLMFRNDVEQIRVNKQRAAADFAIDTVNSIGTNGELNRDEVAEMFSSKVKVYDTLYMSEQDTMSYTPVRLANDAKKYIDSMPDIINSSALVKLKKIAEKGKIKN